MNYAGCHTSMTYVTLIPEKIKRRKGEEIKLFCL